MDDIEDLHRLAVDKGSTTYIDPDTGFTVFTELAHVRRGFCCGNMCRHCPYDWVNVRGKTKTRKVVQPIVVVEKEEEKRQSADERPQSKGGRHGGRFTSKNVPYTRGGDEGKSSLLTGERRYKTDDSFEAMGTVDELCSTVGVVYAELQQEGNKDASLDDWLLDIMSRLFDVGSHLAKPRRIRDEKDDDDDEEEEELFVADGIGGGFSSEHIDSLEDWIDILTEELPELTSFILPTGTKAAALLHVARTVCRRAERRVVPLVHAKVCDPRALQYLNRLSDFLFAAARYANLMLGTKQEEILYQRPTRVAKQRQRVVVSAKNK